MSIQRISVRIMTKYLILIIFSTVFSANIAFSQEKNYLPLGMTIKEFINNCDALIKGIDGETLTRKEELDSSYCMGVIRGIWLSESFGHSVVTKQLGATNTHKPLICFDGKGMSSEIFMTLLGDLVDGLKKIDAQPNELQGSIAAYISMFQTYGCDVAMEGPSSDRKELLNAIFEALKIMTPSKNFYKALKSIANNDLKIESSEVLYKVLFLLGAISATSETFAMEKNSRCGYLNYKKFAQMVINNLENDDLKLISDVSFISHLTAIISSNYKDKCINVNDPIVPNNDEMLMKFVKGNYYSLLVPKWYKFAKESGKLSLFLKGLNEETESIKMIPSNSMERIISERKQEITNLIKKSKGSLEFWYNSGQMGAILNKECDLNPVHQSCFSL